MMRSSDTGKSLMHESELIVPSELLEEVEAGNKDVLEEVEVDGEGDSVRRVILARSIKAEAPGVLPA